MYDAGRGYVAMERLIPFVEWTKGRSDQHGLLSLGSIFDRLIRDAYEKGQKSDRIRRRLLRLAARFKIDGVRSFTGDTRAAMVDGALIDSISDAYVKMVGAKSIDLHVYNLGVKDGSTGPRFSFYDF